MTEVGQADLSRLLQSKRNEYTAIVTSRKRKLRELFAVATHAEALPQDAFAKTDAPAPTPAEWHFLQASDIFQGKKLNLVNIPPRPKQSLDTLRRSLAVSENASAASTTPTPLPVPTKKDASAQSDSSPTQDALSTTKPGSASPAEVVATTPNPLQPTPTPGSLKPSLQPPLTVPSPTERTSTPIATPEPVSAVSAQETEDDASDSTKGAAGQRRPPQVSFPPGTKGSPSTEADAAAAATGPSQVGQTDTRPENDPTNSGTRGNELLSIKLPTDSTRAPDALSSPGSTAPSATTPAVHDVSTDTSPDHDGSQYMETAGQKSDQENDDESVAEGRQEGEGSQDNVTREQATGAVPDPAEDQLLQESSAAADSPMVQRDSTVADAAPKSANSAVDTSKPTTPAVVTTDAEPQVSNPEPAANEIPDSQDATPDRMDVDVPEPSVEADQHILSPREQNIPTQTAPTNSKSPSKDDSQPAERAVTRVSSGAMRLKSVSEIVGVTGRPANITTERGLSIKGNQNQLTPVTSTPQSPSSRNRHPGHRRDRSKSQVSTVLFGKQPKRIEEKSVIPGQKELFQPSEDYFTPLFLQGFAGGSSWMQPLEKILYHANKTVATPDANLAIQDHQACKILRRVYQLQQQDKWSLRQPKRCAEPTRPTSHWDVMLQEMKWMRTDFREERKWKRALAKNLAYACAEWCEATPEERKALQVAAVIPPKQRAEDVAMADGDEGGADSQPTPELVSSEDMDSPQHFDELADVLLETVSPSAIFTLQEDDLVFGLQRTPASDQLLEELPMYGAPLKVPTYDFLAPELDPDAHWRRQALPLSKYVEGPMTLKSEGPPRKRSRYNYMAEDSDDENDGDFVANQMPPSTSVAPTTKEVALFNPETKHIRDRLHAGHQFRPPSEHPMPTQNFYECRSPSQWTVAEDDELRSLVRDYSYNWSLISSILTTRSLFTSGAERRTPWECFERWINLEGLPADMQKTQYFKAYNSRIEAAQRVIAQQNHLAAQQASASGGTVTPVRRRQSTPLRVERRRNQKHLTLIDAMRKLAKKRETTIQKQQHNASQNAANKKTNDPVAQRPTKTPRDYSLLRWERDQALAEKMAQYAQRQEAQRRAAIQARAQGQAAAQMAGAPGAANGAANGAPTGHHPNASNGANGANATGARVHVPNQMAAAAAAAAAGQNRPRVPMQTPNGGATPQMNGNLVPPPQTNGAAQNPIQGVQGQGQRMPMPNQQPDVNLMLRARRISEQQRAVQMQHAQHQQPGTPGLQGQHSSPPLRNDVNGANGANGVNGVTGVNGVNQQNFLNNAQAMIASFGNNNNNNTANNANGHATPASNGLHMPSVANGSPGPRVPHQLSQSLANQLNQLEAQFRAKNPALTPEQARHLATEHLTRAMMAQRQSAMNAAAGGTNQPGIANSIAATTSPHQYAALLRQQQQQQQAQQQQPHQQLHQQALSQSHVQLAQQQAGQSASPAQSHQRQSSGSATPSAGK